jgi:hypothetical protein
MEAKFLLLTTEEILQKEAELTEEFGSKNLYFKKEFSNKFLGGTEIVKVLLRDSKKQSVYNNLITLICIDYPKISRKQLDNEYIIESTQVQIPLKFREFKEFTKEDLEDNIKKSIRTRRRPIRNKKQKIV